MSLPFQIAALWGEPMADTAVPDGNGKITTRQFYDALMQQNDRMDNMERRLIQRLDHIVEAGPPGMVAKVKSLEDEMDTVCAELEQVKKVTYGWGGVNSALALLAGLVGFQGR